MASLKRRADGAAVALGLERLEAEILALAAARGYAPWQDIRYYFDRTEPVADGRLLSAAKKLEAKGYIALSGPPDSPTILVKPGALDGLDALERLGRDMLRIVEAGRLLDEAKRLLAKAKRYVHDDLQLAATCGYRAAEKAVAALSIVHLGEALDPPAAVDALYSYGHDLSGAYAVLLALRHVSVFGEAGWGTVESWLSEIGDLVNLGEKELVLGGFGEG